MPKSARPLIVVIGALLVVIAAGIVEIGCRNEPAATSTAPTAASQTPAAPDAEKKAEADDSSNFNDYGEPMRSGADFPVAMAFARDTRTFTIAPLDGIEFNYRIEKGGTMVYSWKASDDVAWDFHGEPKGAKAGFAESYATGRSKEANGGFMAPSSGIHGWFWQNPSDKKSVTVTLKTAGHYTNEILLTMPDDSRAPQPLNAR